MRIYGEKNDEKQLRDKNVSRDLMWGHALSLRTPENRADSALKGKPNKEKRNAKTNLNHPARETKGRPVENRNQNTVVCNINLFKVVA